jgi:hypothetical protein
MFLITFLELLFLKSYVMGPLVGIVFLTKLFYGVHYFLYYQHGQHVEGVTIIESSFGTKQGDPLGGPLFDLAHY